jgi:hypothetical protein
MAENTKIYGSVSIRYGEQSAFEGNEDKFFKYEFLVGLNTTGPKYDLKLVVPESLNDENSNNKYLTIITEDNIYDKIGDIFERTGFVDNRTGDATLNTEIVDSNGKKYIKTSLLYDKNTFGFNSDGCLSLQQIDENSSIDYYYVGDTNGNMHKLSVDKYGRGKIESSNESNNEGAGNAKKLNGNEGNFYLDGRNTIRGVQYISENGGDNNIIYRTANSQNIVIINKRTQNHTIWIHIDDSIENDDFYIINNSGHTLTMPNIILKTNLNGKQRGVGAIDGVEAAPDIILQNKSSIHVCITATTTENESGATTTHFLHILEKYTSIDNINVPSYITSEGSEISFRPYNISKISTNKIFDEWCQETNGEYALKIKMPKSSFVANGEAIINYIAADCPYSANIHFACTCEGSDEESVLKLIDYHVKTVFSQDEAASIIPTLTTSDDGCICITVTGVEQAYAVVEFKNISYI